MVDRDEPRAAGRVEVVVGAALLGLVGVVLAVGRYPGGLPIGSDNDEYLDVGSRLAALEAPLSAGVEGTKYPLGYPLVLAALERLGLPPGPAAQTLNVLALVAAVALVGWIVGRATTAGPARPVAGLTAAGVLVASTALWRDVYSVMPEILTVLIIVAALGLVARPPTTRRVALLTGLAVAAVLLKTLALLVLGGLVGGALLWALASSRGGGADRPDPSTHRDRPVWWGWLLPPGAALVVVAAGSLFAGRYPPHTTGYLEVVFLRVPSDASQGRIDGIGELLARTAADVPDTVRDLGLAFTLPGAGRWTAALVAVVLLTLGVVAAFRRYPATPAGPAVLVATLGYAAGLALWPYHAPRFGLPLLPVAALGIGWAVGELGARLPRIGRAVLAAAVVAGLLAIGAPATLDEGAADRDRIPRFAGSVDAFVAWADGEVAPDETLVSFDYREVSRRLGRPVQPIGYTADPDAVLAQVGDADVVVAVRGMYGARTSQFDRFVAAHGDRLELVYDDGTTVAYRRGP